MKFFNGRLFYSDMDVIRVNWDLSWSKVAGESGVSVSTIERIREGGGCHIASLMLLCEFFELWDLKRYAMRGDGHGSEEAREALQS